MSAAPLEAGALPGLLPGGRPAQRCVGPRTDRRRHGMSASCRARRAATPRAFSTRPRSGELGALLVGGVELADLPDPDAALAAIDAAPFVVSLELRESAVTELADVVFPVAPVVEKAGCVRQLGGPDSPVRAVAADQRHSRSAGAGLPGRRARRRPEHADARWPPGEEMARLGLWARSAAGRPAGVAVAARTTRQGPGRAGRLAHAARRRDACRTANRTSRAPPARRSRGCRRPPRPRSALPKTIW